MSPIRHLSIFGAPDNLALKLGFVLVSCPGVLKVGEGVVGEEGEVGKDVVARNRKG